MGFRVNVTVKVQRDHQGVGVGDVHTSTGTILLPDTASKDDFYKLFESRILWRDVAGHFAENPLVKAEDAVEESVEEEAETETVETDPAPEAEG